MKLGFFDSGLGGLNIMRSVQKLIPQYEYIYYGDTANMPYGDRNEEEVYNLTKIAVERLFKEDASLVIIACNTSSSETLRKLQDGFLVKNYPDRKILGVIRPTIEEVIDSGSKNVLLIGTVRTISSEKYHKELEVHNINDIKLTTLATPNLVPLIEENKLEEAYKSVSSDIDKHIDNGGDGIILGCTHYVLIKDLIRNLSKIKVFSQNEIIPKKLRKYLDNHEEIKSKLTCHDDGEIHETLITT